MHSSVVYGLFTVLCSYPCHYSIFKGFFAKKVWEVLLAYATASKVGFATLATRDKKTSVLGGSGGGVAWGVMGMHLQFLSSPSIQAMILRYLGGSPVLEGSCCTMNRLSPDETKMVSSCHRNY